MPIIGAVPEPGTRCPRCHRKAPRADGIPCMLCAPGDTSPAAAARRHEERLEAVRAYGADVYADLVAALANRADVPILIAQRLGLDEDETNVAEVTVFVLAAAHAAREHGLPRHAFLELCASIEVDIWGPRPSTNTRKCPRCRHMHVVGPTGRLACGGDDGTCVCDPSEPDGPAQMLVNCPTYIEAKHRRPGVACALCNEPRHAHPVRKP